MAHNQVVLLTGASHGIGKAAAPLLAEAGFTVYGTTRYPERAPALPGVKFAALDVDSDASVAACVEQVLAEAGRIDVLINNAGYAQRGPLEDVTVAQLQAQFETNLFGVHRLTRAVLPGLADRGAGRIINVSSAIGRVAIPLTAAYCASKFALEGYSEGLAKELAGHGVRVAIVEPGLTDTEFHERSLPVAEVSPRYQAQVASGPMRTTDMLKYADSAETVARVILQAATDSEPKLRYACPAALGLIKQAGAERL
jgi:NAD(P)-dependent dehydrogenase (short-subunit alcohol dehydrogenase family)